MLRIKIIICLMLANCFIAFSQVPASNFISIMQEDRKLLDSIHAVTDVQIDSLYYSLYGTPPKISTQQRLNSTCSTTKRVFGWYSGGTSYQNFQWNLLTDLSYFSYVVDPATGNGTGGSSWLSSSSVTAAKQNGVKINLCVQLFGTSNVTTFLSNTTAQQTLINNLISLVQQRGANGVNIDFENLAISHKTALKDFLISLCNQMHSAIPGSEVSIDISAYLDPIDVPALSPYIDLFIHMGYDYYYAGSTTAGPTDPLYNYQSSVACVSSTINSFIAAGISPNKFLLAVPYYGRQWQTQSTSIPSSTVSGTSSAVTHTQLMNNSNGYFSTANWDINSFTPYYTWSNSGNPYQLFIDNSYSMGKRYDIVNQRGLAGIAIWKLGYDDGYTDMWNIISNKLSSCAVVPCKDTIYDMGGPNWNYHNKENYTYTISPQGASNVSLTFNSFGLENTFDSIYLYDGASTQSVLLGGFTGSNNPGTITSSGNSLTLKFKSDNATAGTGFSAVWDCTTGGSWCSGTTSLTAGSGTFTDGSGTNNYGNNSDCRWLIQPTNATSITLNFTAFSTESTNDKVIVYNGDNILAPVLGTFSGTSIPSSVSSTGGSMLVRFVTNGSVTNAGWTANYTSTINSSVCNIPTNANVISVTDSTAMLDWDGFSNAISYRLRYKAVSSNTWITKTSTIMDYYVSSLLTCTNYEFQVKTFCNNGDSSNYSSSYYFTTTGCQDTTNTGSNNIVAYQYWFDADYSNNSFIDLPDEQIINFNRNINVSTLNVGVHVFNIRFIDGNNKWSSVLSSMFYKGLEDNNTINNITDYEYWFDDNYAGKTAVTVTAQKALNLNTGLNTSVLTTGVHVLNIRFKDSGKQWSSVLSSMFYKGLEDNNATNNMTDYEYWFDNNYANKIGLTVSAQKILNLNTGLNTSALTTGVHVLNIRFKDSGKQWSSVLSSLFYKGLMDNNAVNNITDYEYWFDNNYAGKVSTTVSPQKILNLNTGVNASSLQQGVHTINIRFKDSGTQWSSVLSQLFYKNGTTTTSVNKISAYRYWYDRSTSNITTVILPAPVNPNELISNIDVSSLNAGTHTVHFQFKDLIDSWSGVTNDTFNVVAPVKANFIANDTTLCYRGTVTFTNQSTGAVSYLWKFGDGDSSTTVNPSHTYNTPGFYTVTLIAISSQGVKDTLRKVNYISVTVPNVVVSPNVSICTGTSTQLVATGAVTYVWSPSTGLNTTSGSAVTATPVSNTTYRVIGTDQYGCIDTAFVTVNVSSVLQVGLSAAQTTICQGDTVTLTASGANSYSWYPSTGLNTITGNIVKANPVTTTTYNVIGTSTCGSDTESVTITVKPKPVTNAGRDTAICSGKSVLLTASGATSYVWSNGVNTAVNAVAPLSATSYIVTGTTNGCSTKDTVLVNVNPLPVVSLPDVAICPGGSYVFDAGNSGASYLWQNSTTGQQLTANSAGLYWVQVTNNFGCVKRDSAIVTLSPSLTINLRDTTVCQGQVVTLNAGNPGATYLWNNGAQTQSISITQGGSYSVIVTGSGGCTGRDTAIVTIKPLPSTNAGRDTAICSGKSVLLTATGATSYAWSNGVNVAGNTVAPISATSYIVIGTSNGCSSKDTVVVNVNPLPAVNLPDVTICPGGSYVFDAGNSGASYLWQNSTTGQQLTANSAGLYWVQVTNNFGCVKRDSATISVTPSLTINLRDTAVCQGQIVTLNASNPGATYLWNNGAQTQSISITQGGSYSVIVTGSGGCTGRDTAIVTIKPLPSTNAGRDTAICSGKSVLLTATGATSYVWSNGVNTSGNTVTPISTTGYIVTGTTNGCSTKDTVLVNVNLLPIVSLPDVTICLGGSYIFDAGNSGASYLWQNSTTSQQLTANSAGLYWVQVTSTFGCVSRDSAIMSVSNNLNIGLRDTSICLGQSVTLNAGNIGASYLWSTGAITQTITVTQGNTYSVLVTASGGCSKSDTAVVAVLPLPVVTLNLIDTVSLNTPPFSLSGGLPAGGSYSGAGVSGGVFNPSVAGPGKHVITYTYTDVNGCSNLNRDSIFVQIVTGITDTKNDIHISIYPNPSNGIIKFTVSNVKEENGEVEIINNLGQILYSDKISISNPSEFTFDISNFASGVYYLKIRINDKFKTYPIEVVK